MPKLLSLKIQQQIRTMRKAGKTVRQIARGTKVAKNSVLRYMNRTQGQKKRRIVKRLGRATSLTANLKERIKRVLKKKRLKNVSELKRELRSKLCETTLRKAMREIGAEFDSEKRPFYLSAKHKDARVEFAEEQIRKSPNYAVRIYVDEKKFNLDGPDGLLKRWYIPDVSPPVEQRSKNFK
ncbi:MAG: hypothetical protein EZS28_044297, partial [Streblomastix strix]